MHGKGRVFYTSMGHESIWRTKPFRQVLMGGMAWALHNVDAEIPPNVAEVTPEALRAKT
jgi:type 1 glutamine amidotransferase